MTPDRRLDQLEPLMADSLQKIDRLIEGQGQILDVATRADQKADTTAKGLANLTLSSQKQFEVLKAGQDELKANQDEFKANLDGLRFSQDEFKANLDELKINQNELKSNQEMILKILREKLP